jgi:hypothetical protein
MNAMTQLPLLDIGPAGMPHADRVYLEAVAARADSSGIDSSALRGALWNLNTGEIADAAVSHTIGKRGGR